jgi:hypothetical protein
MRGIGTSCLLLQPQHTPQHMMCFMLFKPALSTTSAMG